MVDYFLDKQMVQHFLESYDETSIWCVPDDEAALKSRLSEAVGKNDSLHIYKYIDTSAVLAKHKEADDVIFVLANKECVMVHFPDTKDSNDRIHLVYFSNLNAVLKYMAKRYRMECLGEKEIVLTKRDRSEILIFLLELIMMFVMPASIRPLAMILSGLVLGLIILLDWKENGFNLFRDKKQDHINVLPLLRFQIAYVLLIGIFVIIGIIVFFISVFNH
ncbi:MAG: hypothetical protein Q4F95_03605 [Oscillospiraceae bacterium]|nr:hypothetical protein [Oscillospiraceae bacterium]